MFYYRLHRALFASAKLKKITLAKEEEENKKERRTRMKKGGEERKAMISFYVGYFGDVLAEKNKEKEDHLEIPFSKFGLVM